MSAPVPGAASRARAIALLSALVIVLAAGLQPGRRVTPVWRRAGAGRGRRLAPRRHRRTPQSR